MMDPRAEVVNPKPRDDLAANQQASAPAINPILELDDESANASVSKVGTPPMVPEPIHEDKEELATSNHELFMDLPPPHTHTHKTQPFSITSAYRPQAWKYRSFAVPYPPLCIFLLSCQSGNVRAGGRRG